MDKLKAYAVPVIALLLLLAWFFVVRPMLDEGSESAEPAKAQQAP